MITTSSPGSRIHPSSARQGFISRSSPLSEQHVSSGLEKLNFFSRLDSPVVTHRGKFNDAQGYLACLAEISCVELTPEESSALVYLLDSATPAVLGLFSGERFSALRSASEPSEIFRTALELVKMVRSSSLELDQSNELIFPSGLEGVHVALATTITNELGNVTALFSLSGFDSVPEDMLQRFEVQKPKLRVTLAALEELVHKSDSKFIDIITWAGEAYSRRVPTN